MSENKLLYTVKDIFSEYLHKEKKSFFNIPEYQRGYKWNSENVKILLDDLLEFQKSNKSNNSFYCLQNITLVPFKYERDNRVIDCYNVVDGQQRLTTLYILLSYLRKKEKTLFNFSNDCLQYSVRQETGKMLREHVFTGILWDSPVIPDSSKHKDQWYILDVAKSIQEWFEDGQGKINHDLTSETILNRLKLIINEMSEGNETSVFAGLNGGRVELDGADLVRAELITRSAQERFVYERDLSDVYRDRINEFRVRIGMELDEINQWWSDENHIIFFEQMLRDKTSNTNNHMFDYHQHPIDLLYLLYYECDYSEGEEINFRFFEHGRDTNNIRYDHDHWELYESLIKLHHTMEDWYNDSKIYHWLGYLFFNFKAQENGDDKVTYRYIYRKWGQWKKWTEDFPDQEKISRIETRSQFTHYLVDLSKRLLLSKYVTENEKESQPENILNSNILDLKNTDWYNGETIRLQEILVLMDVLICTDTYAYSKDDKNKGKRRLIENRILPSYFKMNKENKEHIRSCTPNDAEGQCVYSKQEWINHINYLYSGEKEGSNENILKKKLLEFINKVSTPEGILKETVISDINNILNSHAQNSIGNLLLLNEHVNKSYGNMIFNQKIQRIIREYMQQKYYIRPFTLLVFLSKMKGEDTQWRWTKVDIENNAKNIRYQIKNFLNM